MTHDAETLLPCPFCGSENVKLFPATCHQSTPYDPADRMYPVAQCWNCHAGAVGSNNDGPRDVRETQSAVTAWNTRAALEAMEPRVKALEWVTPSPTTDGQWQDTTGIYDIEECILFIGHVETGIRFKTVKEAKAAAQADYERRILSAIDLAPAKGPTVAEAARVVEAAQWARNRLEKIADDSWHGDARDFKRSLGGVFRDFDEALEAAGSTIPPALTKETTP